MTKFETTVAISAPVETIWEILAKGQDWPTWNTTIDNVEGNIALGEKITIYSKVTPGRAFSLKVTSFSPPNRMVWTGGMPLGLFTGKRTYTLTTQPDGDVEFAMEEVFSGLFAPLITKSIPDLQPSLTIQPGTFRLLIFNH